MIPNKNVLEVEVIQTCQASVVQVYGDTWSSDDQVERTFNPGSKLTLVRFEGNSAIVRSTIQRKEQESVVTKSGSNRLLDDHKIVDVTRSREALLAIPIESTNLLSQSEIKPAYLAGGTKWGILNEDTLIPLILDGKEAGQVKAKAGTRFPVESETDTSIVLKVNESPLSMAKGKVKVALEPFDSNDLGTKNIASMVEKWKSEQSKSETESDKKQVKNSPGKKKQWGNEQKEFKNLLLIKSDQDTYLGKEIVLAGFIAINPNNDNPEYPSSDYFAFVFGQYLGDQNQQFASVFATKDEVGRALRKVFEENNGNQLRIRILVVLENKYEKGIAFKLVDFY